MKLRKMFEVWINKKYPIGEEREGIRAYWTTGCYTGYILEFLGESWLVSANTNEILNEWVVNLGRKDWKRNPEYKNAHGKTLSEALDRILDMDCGVVK